MEDESRRRTLLGAVLIVAGAAAFRRSFAAGNASRDDRSLRDFEAIEWDAVGELVVEQSDHDSVSVEAEAAVLPKILTESRQGRLRVSLAPGNFQTREPIRIRVAIRTLRVLSTRGSGRIRIGPLRTDTLTLDLAANGDLSLERLTAKQLVLRMQGAGDVRIDGGELDTQRVVLSGSGQYAAPHLASRRADVLIEGSGSVELAARDDLLARIAGSGEIAYRGQPAVRQRISGAGVVTRIEG